MIVSLIVAASENNVIGKNNDLIWRLPADIKYFKDKTIGHHVLMGRKNFESIPVKFRPLPGRTNIVVTRQTGMEQPGIHFVKDIADGIKIANQNGESELFVIGGGEIYRQSLDLADKIYLTRVHSTFDGDTYFPEINMVKWKEVRKDFREADDSNPFDMTFLEYEKI